MFPLSERQILILITLLNQSDWCTSYDLSVALTLNKKTIQQEIRLITDALGEDCIIEIGNQKGYLLKYLSPHFKSSLLEHYNRHGEHHSLKKRDSLIQLFILFQDDYISMEHISNLFFISKSSVAIELNKVKRRLNRIPNVNLIVSNQKGIKLDVEENERRYRLAQLCSVNLMNELPFPNEMKHQYEHIVSKLGQILKNALIKHHYPMDGEDYRHFVYYVSICILRSTNGYIPTTENAFVTSVPVIDKIDSDVQKELQYHFYDSEKFYLFQYINEYSRGAEGKAVPVNIEQCVATFERILADDYHLCPTGFCFKNRQLFIAHVHNMFCRISNGYRPINYYSDTLISNYPLEAYLVKKHFPQLLKMDISRIEIPFLIPFLADTLRPMHNKIKVLIVSDQNIGIIFSIQHTLEFYFSNILSEIQIEPYYAFTANADDSTQYDLRLTTEAETLIRHPDFYLIPVLLKENHLLSLRKKIAEISTSRYANLKSHLKKKSILKHIVIKEHLSNLNDLFDSCDLNKAIGHTVYNILYLCCIDKNLKQSAINIYHLEKGYLYNEKNIHFIIYVNYKSDEYNIYDFFHLVSELLNQLKG